MLIKDSIPHRMQPPALLLLFCGNSPVFVSALATRRAECLLRPRSFPPNEKSNAIILRLSLHLPEHETFLRTTRVLSRCLLEDMKVHTSVIDDVETIVGELCANVVRHAQSSTPHFLITLEYYPANVVITVTDTGTGFNRESIAPVGTTRPDGKGGERVGGFGLSLVATLADRVEFSVTQPHGTTVRVEKVLIYDTPQDAAEAAARDTGDGGFVTADYDAE